MLSRYIRRLCLLKREISKCGARRCSTISDATLIEVVRKRSKIQGWVRALRHMKNNIFVDVSDGSTCKMLQVVIPKSAKPNNLTYGCSISAEGELALAPNGRTELHATDVRVIGTCKILEDNYPFVPRKKYDQDYVREFLHLRPRTRSFASLLRLRDLTTAIIGDYLRERGFINIHTPILTSNDCEGAGEVFLVKPYNDALLKIMKKEGQSENEIYFNNAAFLTVSGQLHLETVARALTKVYTFGPTFRAENSKSRFRLSEFYMLEAEIAFITRIEELMEEIELLLKEIVKRMIEKGAADMHSIGASEPHWLNKKFGCLTYEEAFNILNDNANHLECPIKYGEKLSKEHELFLVRYNDGVPVFVINWPKDIKSFYMKECTDDPSKVAALDLLAPEVGELAGGSVREDDYGKLERKLPVAGNLSWYLDLRKYGNVPTSGYGMGFERFLQSILGIDNIKDTIPFPRWSHNCNL
ncbi:hypothetical protein HN011_003324 [Eciton burchellii]|nr:hypothetical protein HN011_003324 [Eciton burchellii]